jgi:hypothetical protein
MGKWRSRIEFLARAGEASIPPGWQFNLLSDVLGVTSRIKNATEGNFPGPFFTQDAPDRP